MTISLMRHDRRVRVLLAAIVTLLLGQAAGRAADTSSSLDLPGFLALKEIDLARRGVLDAGGPWSDEKELVLVRVLARMRAPAKLAAAWSAAAVDVAAHGEATEVGDRLVRVRGRATFVARRELPPAVAEQAGQQHYDLVRMVDDRAAVVDVVVPHAPQAWPRWRAIDEPAVVVGLPLAAGPGPVPAAAPDAAQPWPSAAPDLLIAATDVAWTPPTPLGRLGVDYGLFDGVVDDRKLEPGDSPAFWAVMAAATRTTPREIAAAAGGRTDILPLIDPAQKWFGRHRGDPVVIEGVARVARRLTIDEPEHRAAVGSDHYWELEVFVDTPPLEVNGRAQDRYPIVCCVRSLTDGMPSGDSISERVRVPAFAFKRYAYRLRDAVISSSLGDSEIKDERMVTPLVIGPLAEWLPPPSTAGASNLLFWVFGGITAAVACLMAYSTWSAGRQARRTEAARRAALPDRLQLPGE